MTTTASGPHTDLATVKPNTYFDGVYSILNPQVGTTRAGKAYLKCLIRDATGELPGRQWSFEDGRIADINATGFVWIAGYSQEYNGQTQIILEQVKAVDVDDADLVNLLPSTKKDINQMYAEVQGIMQSLSHPAMRALADAYLGDDALMAEFRRAPAAVSMHHAWIGGLLEHTHQLLHLAEAMLGMYPELDRDLVLMGLFLHDLGKTAELSWEKGFNYTADGNLIGHIVRGAIWLQVKAAIAARESGQRLPGDALRVLQHIILSHHGEPEYGAAKVPSTPEAIFVALLDNLDAKTAMAVAAARTEHSPGPNEGGGFTDKIWALQTRLYCPNPLAEPPAE